MMRRIATTLGMALLLGAGTSLGCAGGRLDDGHGDAFRANRDAQIENPHAGAQATPEGLDPRTAEHVLENYSEGQRAQEHPRSGSSGSKGVLIGEIK